MKKEELLTMDSQSLTHELQKTREALRALRFRASMGQEKNVRALRVYKKDIARLSAALVGKKVQTPSQPV